MVPGLLLAALVAFLVWRFPEVLAGEGEGARLVHAILLLAFLGMGAVAHWRLRPKGAARAALIWLAVGAVLFLGYAYRFEAAAVLDRLAAELLPHRGRVAGGTATFHANAAGHFVVAAEVDGQPVRFLVDTGASDVTLSGADARRLGFDPEKLSYTRRYQTANGVVHGAPVRLGRVTIGPIVVEDVPAAVTGAPMSHSLLGMSFLRRLAGFAVAQETLTLRQ